MSNFLTFAYYDGVIKSLTQGCCHSIDIYSESVYVISLDLCELMEIKIIHYAVAKMTKTGRQKEC